MERMVIDLKWEMIEEKGKMKKLMEGLIIKEIKLDKEKWEVKGC